MVQLQFSELSRTSGLGYIILPFRIGGPESQLIEIVENLISYFVIEQTAIGNPELLPCYNEETWESFHL